MKKLLSFLVVTAMICSLVSFGTAFAAEETVVFSYDFDSSTVADGRQLCGDVAKVAADYSAKYLAASDQVYVTTDPANQLNRVAWICSKCTSVGGYATNANPKITLNAAFDTTKLLKVSGKVSIYDDATYKPNYYHQFSNKSGPVVMSMTNAWINVAGNNIGSLTDKKWYSYDYTIYYNGKDSVIGFNITGEGLKDAEGNAVESISKKFFIDLSSSEVTTDLEDGYLSVVQVSSFGNTERKGAIYIDDVTVKNTVPDSSLSGISVNGSPINNFSSDVLEYTVSIPANSEGAVITASAKSNTASITYSGNDFTSFPRTVSVVCTEGSTTTTYNVIILKDSDDENKNIVYNNDFNHLKVGEMPELYAYDSAKPVTGFGAISYGKTSDVSVSETDSKKALTFKLSQYQKNPAAHLYVPINPSKISVFSGRVKILDATDEAVPQTPSHYLQIRNIKDGTLRLNALVIQNSVITCSGVPVGSVTPGTWVNYKIILRYNNGATAAGVRYVLTGDGLLDDNGAETTELTYESSLALGSAGIAENGGINMVYNNDFAGDKTLKSSAAAVYTDDICFAEYINPSMTVSNDTVCIKGITEFNDSYVLAVSVFDGSKCINANLIPITSNTDLKKSDYSIDESKATSIKFMLWNNSLRPYVDSIEIIK